MTQRQSRRRHSITALAEDNDTAGVKIGESEPQVPPFKVNGVVHKSHRPPRLSLSSDDKQKGPDERELRSKHGCSRVETVLTKFFPDYEDIMFGELLEEG